MIFTSPIPFREALDFLRRKSILPTSASSAQLAELPADIRARGLFSARTANADYLQRIQDLADQLLNPQPSTHQPSTIPLDPATMRLRLKEALREISYDPAQIGAAPGTLKDLGSDARLNLIIQMQTDSAWGYGKFIRDQDPAAIDAWPAQELFRAESRREPRDWPQRWMAAGGQFFGGGRMIALKNDSIWTEISAFGQPYPPFDYGSGMWVRDISRSEAISLGLLDPVEAAPPPLPPPPLNDGLQASLNGIAPDLQQAILDSMGDLATFADGVLHLKN